MFLNCILEHSDVEAVLQATTNCIPTAYDAYVQMMTNEDDEVSFDDDNNEELQKTIYLSTTEANFRYCSCDVMLSKLGSNQKH